MEKNKLKFVRFGPLGATDYGKPTHERFHSPPVREGIFAFIYPYVEPFLWAWKVKYKTSEELNKKQQEAKILETDPYDVRLKKNKVLNEIYEELDEEYGKQFDKYYRKNKHVFQYDGPLWTHLDPERSAKNVGSWYLINSGDLPELLRKVKHIDVIGSAKCISSWRGDEKKEMDPDVLQAMLQIKNPYKRGLGGFTSTDHLEVFIEKRHLGKIR